MTPQAKERFATLFLIISLVIASFSIGTTVYAGLSSSYTTIIQAGSGVETASYTIFKDGSTYYAKNGSTGAIDYSSTNITALYEDARDSLASSGGGTVFFVSGTYLLPVVLIPETGVNIVGEGWSTVLKAQNSQSAFYTNYGCIRSAGANHEENYTIRDLKVDGNRENQADTSLVFGILLINVSNVQIENVYAQNATNGIFVRTDVYGVDITNCYSTLNSRYGIGYGTRAENCSVTNSHCWNNEYDGINIDEECKYVSAENNYCTRNRNGIITQATAIDKACVGLDIIGNTITNNQYDGLHITRTNFSLFTANTIVDNGHDGIEITDSYSLNVGDNNIISNDGHGINIADLDNSLISNNLVVNNGNASFTNHGIKLNNCEDNGINGNRCYDDQTSKTQRWGIIEQGTSDYNSIIGDHCKDNWSGGIKIVGSNTECHSCFNGTSWVT